MKVLQTAVALVPVAVMVGLQGCGGTTTTTTTTTTADYKCVIKQSSKSEPVPGYFRWLRPSVPTPQDKDIDCKVVSKECCDFVNTRFKREETSSSASARKSFGKCGRNDQVNLFKCIKVAAGPFVFGLQDMAKIAPGLKLCTTAPAVGEGADGDGTCMAGKGLSVPGVSTDCCTAILAKDAATRAADQGDPSSQKDQGEVDAVCGVIGACGKKDQDNFWKWETKRFGKGKGKGGAAIVELKEYMPPAESVLGQESLEYLPPMFAFEEFPETEALEEEQSVTEYQSAGMAAIGFIAGAAFTGLRIVALNRREQKPLEEPLTA